MSSIERNKGILTYIGELTEELAERLVKDEGRELPKHYGSYVAYYKDECWGFSSHLLLGNSAYFVEYEVRAETEAYSFADVVVHPSGQIEFHTMHYNGGGSLEEVIENILKEQEL